MRRQHTPLFLLTQKGTKIALQANKVDEQTLQSFIFDYPSVLPIEEIEYPFASAVPLCRELPTAAGALDILLINPQGFLTLVECKLYKNPGARREVIGQILDYAQSLSEWDYEMLEATVDRARKSQGLDSKPLYDLLAEHGEIGDEVDFVDNVNKNLRKGRFLLLIVGDGIRERVEQIASFLEKHAYLNFSLSLLEIEVFSLPETEHLIIQPRIIAQTVDVERAVIRIEGGKVITEMPNLNSDKPSARSKVSEQIFFESLSLDVAQPLKHLIHHLKDEGFVIEPGDNSLKVKWNLAETLINFLVINNYGTCRNFGIASVTEKLGVPEIGLYYLNNLAELLDDSYVYHKPTNKFWTTVKKKDGTDITVHEILTKQTEWLNLLQETITLLESSDYINRL